MTRMTTTTITAADRAALVAYAASGSYVLEMGDDRYISNNTKTETFWEMFVAERGGDVLQANDDLYDLLNDLLDNEYAYRDQNRSAALAESVWVFNHHPEYYLKVCIEPHKRWIQVVIHHHWQQY